MVPVLPVVLPDELPDTAAFLVVVCTLFAPVLLEVPVELLDVTFELLRPVLLLVPTPLLLEVVLLPDVVTADVVSCLFPNQMSLCFTCTGSCHPQWW